MEFIKISNKHVDVDYSSVVAPSLKEKLSPNDDAITDKDDSNGRDNDAQISSMRKVNLFSDQPPSTCDFSSVPKSICVGVRTMPSHKDWIGTMISGLSNQYRASILNQNQFNLYRRKTLRNNGLKSISASEVSLGLQIYIANTEIPDTDYLLFLRDLVHQANENMFFKSQADQNCHVRLLYDMYAPFHRVNNALYGYDSTDMMLKEMLREPHCEWILFSNGDNFYNRAWFSTVSSIAASNEQTKIIGWNFITHHVRDGQYNSVVKIKLERAHVDLGSVMIKSAAFYQYQSGEDEKTNETSSFLSISPMSRMRMKKSSEYDSHHRFLPQSIATDDIFARDFFLIQAINESLSFSKHVKLIDACLMFHQ